MDDLDDDVPRSLPCSAEEAKLGLPVMVQLQFVDAGLEKHPYPREDFYRQYSVTPERQSPEKELTPPLPLYSPGAILQKSKDWAAKIAKGLRQFHAGRVMLRKEEGEQNEDLEKDPQYWKSKAERWQDEIMRLIREIGKRKKQELKGEAEEGYAQAMLLSPLQSLSSSPPNHILSEITKSSKSTVTASDELTETENHTSQRQAGPSDEPTKITSEHGPDNLPSLSKDQKRTRRDVEDQERESSEHNSCVKRQRKEAAIAKQSQKHVLATENIQSPGTSTLKVRRANSKEGPDIKSRSPKAPFSKHTLPWKSRSRNRVPYREIDTRTNIEDRGRQATKKFDQKALRRRVN